MAGPTRRYLRKPIDVALRAAGDDRQRDYQRQRARKSLERFLTANLGGFYEPQPFGPMPPVELIETTAVLNQADIDIAAAEWNYEVTGIRQLLGFLEPLVQTGANLRTVGSVLDFGCGTGRLLRHLRSISGIELVGTDADTRAVDWCKANLDGIRFESNELDPPLAHAGDGAFDLVISYSVFTHIPLDRQDAWIEEMSRVIAPGGHLACTVLGNYHIRQMLTPEQRQRLERGEPIQLDESDENASYSTQVLGSWDVFQTRTTVLRTFGRHFDVLDYRSAVQDVLILRRR